MDMSIVWLVIISKKKNKNCHDDGSLIPDLLTIPRTFIEF